MSDTPRTDAEAYDTGLLLLEDDAHPDIVVQVSFARDLERELAAKTAEVERLREALQRIEKWFGEFPPSERYWDPPNNTKQMSYAAAFGSNGERDYMRGIARAALREPAL